MRFPWAWFRFGRTIELLRAEDDLMNLIAAYQTKQPLPKRQFELYEDSVRAVGSRNSMDLGISLPLARLDCRFERVSSHSPLFYQTG